MIKKIFCKNAVLACTLLVTSSVALAIKPGSEPRAPSIAINSAVVDASRSEVRVTGSGLESVDQAILGGVNVSADIEIDAITGNLKLLYSTSMAEAVQSAGNYSLQLNGNSFSVYFNSAVTDPGITATCPCLPEWQSFGADAPPAGFSGLDPYCSTESVDNGQAAVQFLNFDYGQAWILTSEFNSNAKTCALVFDAPTRVLNSKQEHDACAAYLKILIQESTPQC